MLSKIDSPDPLYTAPLALLNFVQAQFPATLNAIVTEAIRNHQGGHGAWQKATYVPARMVRETMVATGEGAGRSDLELDHAAVNFALCLAWAQRAQVIEVGKQRYLGAIERLSPHKGIPVERLGAFPEFALCFTAESLRMSAPEQNSLLLMVMVYLDQIPVARVGKTIPELTIALLYDHRQEKQLETNITKIPLSNGLSYLDAVSRAKKHGRAVDPRYAMFAAQLKGIRTQQLEQEAMQASLLVEMTLDICAAMGGGAGPRIVLPNDRGQVIWPKLEVLTFT